MGEAGWFETLRTESVYDGFSRIRIDTVRTPDGGEVDREVVERVGAVGIVAVDTRGRVLLVRQYRHPVGTYLLEIPAGLLDVPGEQPDRAARRELAEEVAHEAGELLPLTSFVNSAGWCDERTQLYLARDCTPTPAPDGFEAEAEEADMEVVPLAVDAAIDAVRDGSITDAKSVIGLLLAEPYLRGSVARH